MSTERIVNAMRTVKATVSQWVMQGVGRLRSVVAPVRTKFSHPVTQKRIILIIVCLALLLDNMLYMVIVPIIDEYFEETTETTTVPSVARNYEITTSIWSLNQTATSDNTDAKSHSKSEILKSLEKLDLKPVKLQDSKDGMMGLLFASKAIVQLCINPFTGAFIDRVGYVTPLTMGLMVMFLSTTVFACAESYAWLFLARSLQGFGSALADTSSFGLIADRFHNEAERSKALGISLAFISFGSLVAPPFGGVLYEFVGRPIPFVILALTCLFNASLLLLVEVPPDDDDDTADKEKPVGTPIYKLLMDPYIVIIAGALSIANFPLAFLEPTIAEWMEDKMQADPWQIGLIWLPPFIPHVIGVLLTVKLSAKYFRFQWLYGTVGLLTIGISTIMVPFCNSFALLIGPLSLMCFGIALIDTALLPTLAFLVDVRHTSVYGSVYAIADISYSVAYALGPVLAGQAVQYLGYTKMNILIGLGNLFFAPSLFALRKVYDWNKDRTERHQLLHNVIDDERDGYNCYSDVNGEETKKMDVSSSETNAINDSKVANYVSEIVADNVVRSQRRKSDAKSNLHQEYDKQVVTTSIRPRPRPQPHTESSTERKIETHSFNDIKEILP